MTACSETIHDPVTLDVRRRGDARVVTLAGDLTRAEALRLRDALFALDREAGPVVLDLGGVCFMSASGIGLLVELGRHLHPRGSEVALAHVSGPVRELLRLTHVDTILPVWDTVDAALALAAVA